MTVEELLVPMVLVQISVECLDLSRCRFLLDHLQGSSIPQDSLEEREDDISFSSSTCLHFLVQIHL